MIIRKSIPLTIACGLLLASAQPVRPTTPFLQLATRATLLAAGAFGINYLGYYLESKLKHSQLSDHNKYGLMGATAATWLLSNYYIIRAALSDSYWHNPDIFKF